MTAGLLVTLALHGLAIGMLLFLIASGLSLIFGLMNILNFAHGSIFMWGAYLGMAAYVNTGSLALALLAGGGAGALIGFLMEYFTIRPLYQRHIYQILLTLGLMLVLDELLKAVWGPAVMSFPKPGWLAGGVAVLGRDFPVYRLFIIAVGLLVLAGMHFFLTRSKTGIIIRAGVENAEMVQALGINVRRVFTLVFGLGAALAALGGVVAGPLIGLYPQMGLDYQLSAFIVVVLGGLGSFAGSAVGSVLVGLSQSFVGYYFPQGAMALNVVLMAAVLLIRPEGLFGTRKG